MSSKKRNILPMVCGVTAANLVNLTFMQPRDVLLLWIGAIAALAAVHVGDKMSEASHVE